MLPSERMVVADVSASDAGQFAEHQFPDIGSRCAPLRAMDIYQRLRCTMKEVNPVKGERQQGEITKSQLLNAAFLGCALKYHINAPRD